MSKPFDATTKYLLEQHAAGLAAYLGLRVSGPVSVLNVDLSTITAEVDGVLRVDDLDPWLMHVEFQSSSDAHLGHRLLRYNVLLNYREELPVQSVALLLRPEADGPAMNGVFDQCLPDGDRYLEFRYKVVRAWEQPIDAILQGDLGTLPLAPLADVTPEALPGVVRRMRDRLEAEATPEERAMLWSATYILGSSAESVGVFGLREPSEVVQQSQSGHFRRPEAV